MSRYRQQEPELFAVRRKSRLRQRTDRGEGDDVASVAPLEAVNKMVVPPNQVEFVDPKPSFRVLNQQVINIGCVNAMMMPRSLASNFRARVCADTPTLGVKAKD